MGVIVPSFPVQNFVPVPYQGDLTAVNIWLLTGGVVTRPTDNGGLQIVNQGHQSKTVQTTYEWINQYPGQAVTVNFQNNNNANANLLDKIVMAYINNANNINDVTVYFPDTGMFVTAPAGSAGYYPVFTNVWVAYVYNGITGSNSVTDPIAQTTQIIFCNFAVPGFLSQTGSKTTRTFSEMINLTTSPSVLLDGTNEQYELLTVEAAITAFGSVTAGAYTQAGCAILCSPFGTGGVILSFSAAQTADKAGMCASNGPVFRANWTAAPYVLPKGTSVVAEIFAGNINVTNVLATMNLSFNIL